MTSISRSAPNIVVLILDTIRAKNVYQASGSRNTPGIAKFGAEHTVFSNAFTTSTWTVPTHASILSGLYLSEHRIENVHGKRRLNPAIETLPTVLHKAGYRTAAMSQNFLFGPDLHFNQGFDSFEVLNGADLAVGNGSPLHDRNAPTSIYGKLRRYQNKLNALPRFVDGLIAWIKRAGTTPFFLMANITSAHSPWAPAPDLLVKHLGMDIRYIRHTEYVGPRAFEFNCGIRTVTNTHRRIWRSLYQAAIEHVDREIGLFLAWLELQPDWANTIVIITADHGEMLGEHRDIVGHTLSLHDNITHVPLVVRHPDYIQPRAVAGVVQTMDLYPTLIEWADAPTDDIPAAQLQRPSLTHAMDRPQKQGGLAFAEEDYTDGYPLFQDMRRANPALDPDSYPLQQQMIRSATHKFVWCDNGRHEYYNMVDDPAEERNLWPDPPDNEAKSLASLQAALAEWREGLVLFPPVEITDREQQDQQVTERLRALGYLA